ncbi:MULTISPECIES: GGDEF domain-containing protein [unclassified Pseudodesulfovibrio]|uniref:GGDEF domain-containing protein n=1 Tax=unclassified Pseudodesulfovibrio TaxID=2661612 RepID=UPI0013E386A9|nr:MULTISPECIES: GGDEF domain-containing protein [unclassified Pseudodesulfovibrio]MCJ2166110.1 diguanylate cyclase [Pseudodesulfovibrio sp. S3-i]
MLIGSIAYYMVKRDVVRASAEHTFKSFNIDFGTYVKSYGGVKAAMESEKFDAFVERIHRLIPSDQGREVDDASYSTRWQERLFGYLVLSGQGVVLHPARGFRVGDKPPPEIVDQALGIEVDGKTVAKAVLVGETVLTEQDERYLAFVRHSLVTGLIIAVGVSSLLCLVFGRMLSSVLRNLAEAIRLMRANRKEVCQVEVVSDDELGLLTEYFNQMNVELAKAHVELRELAIRDPLTNLYNRRHFDEQARQFYESASRYGQPLSLMIGSLDDLKKINDDFSYEIGDLVLEKVAEIMSGVTRKSDVVARYGDEEMVVLFANTDKENAAVSCENIRKAIESYPWGGFAPNLVVTMSIGLCDNTGHSSSAAMFSKADQLMHTARADGRNRVACD